MIGLLDMDRQGRVRAALDRSGHTISCIHTPSELFTEIRSGRIDTLVVEAVQPDQRTADLLGRLRPHALPVLVVARDRSVSTAVEMLRSGASDYLAVPFEYESLLRAVERLLDESLVVPLDLPGNEPFVTQDADSQGMLELLRKVAASDTTILIQGESGTGKELLARMVHGASPRRNRELVSINCAALPSGLLESELFGHERGAFTGALARVTGKFELAHETTILLDEIGELELGLQAKLLRVVQEKQVQRIGAPRPTDVDFRLVTTTNRDLAEEVQRGRFREDLYYRLNVMPIRVKPLRERPDDISLLLRHLTHDYAIRGLQVPRFPDATLQSMFHYAWPGNVRELENLIERLVLTHGGSIVTTHDLDLPGLSVPESIPGASSMPFGTIREMERWLIVRTLTRREGNRTQTARDLDISLRTLRNKIHEYEINEPETLPRSGIATSKRLGRSRPARMTPAEATR